MNAANVLCPVDFSEASQTALDMAVGACASNGTLLLLHVVDVGLARELSWFADEPEPACLERMKVRAREQLAAYRPGAKKGDVFVEKLVVAGIPFLQINKVAEEKDVELIVMGKFGRRGKVEKMLFGTTAEKVLRWTQVPVLVV